MRSPIPGRLSRWRITIQVKKHVTHGSTAGSSLFVEAIVFDLGEQRLVADLQYVGRLGLVAAGLPQDLLDHLGLHGPGRLASCLLEASVGRPSCLGRPL